MRIHTGGVGVLSVLAWGLVLGCNSSSEPEKPGEQSEAVKGSSGVTSHGDDDSHNGADDSKHRDDDDPGVCAVTETSTQRVMTFDTKGDRDDGALEWHDKLVTNLSDGTITDEIVVNSHNRQIFHSTRRFSPNKAYEITTDYAPPLTAVRHVVVSSQDGTAVTAVVDGRATRPFVPAPGVVVRFLDGTRAPEVRVPPPLERAAVKLFERAPKAAGACFQAKTAAPLPSAQGVSTLAALPTFDPGHPTSDTHLDAGCLTLVAGTYAAYYECLSTFVALSIGCGPFAWACVGASVLGCSVALAGGLALDSNSDVCCPAACGGDSFEPNCCARGESCLSEQRGLCCDGSKVACGGQECCGKTDTRLPAAPLGQKCCPEGHDPCGSVCCDVLETCTDSNTGTCCPRPCGNKCCAITDSCDFSTNDCIPPPPPTCDQPCVTQADCPGNLSTCTEVGCCQDRPL